MYSWVPGIIAKLKFNVFSSYKAQLRKDVSAITATVYNEWSKDKQNYSSTFHIVCNAEINHC